MKTAVCALIFLWFSISCQGLAAERPKALVLLAAAALDEINQIPEKAIPQNLLQNAVAVAVFPSATRGGYVIGGQYGRGVISYRRPGTGAFGPPAFFTLHGGSIGFQLGLQEVDLILVFNTEASFLGISEGSGFRVGLEISGTAGPVGRDLQINKTMTDNAPVFSYSMSKGLFAGISLSSTKLTFDYDWSKVFYAEPYSARMILMDEELRFIPQEALHFIEQLSVSAP